MKSQAELISRRLICKGRAVWMYFLLSVANSAARAAARSPTQKPGSISRRVLLTMSTIPGRIIRPKAKSSQTNFLRSKKGSMTEVKKEAVAMHNTAMDALANLIEP